MRTLTIPQQHLCYHYTMPSIHPARTQLRAVLRQPEPQLNLAEAALCIAWEDQGIAMLPAALRELDSLAAAAEAWLTAAGKPREVVLALNRFLFSEIGFRGNTWNYSDPMNSFLDQVLATRAGLPITLSIIYMEVGWRLGLPVSGVALPGHFLARYTGPNEELFIDAFNRGRLWSRTECITQITTFYRAADAYFVKNILQPPSHRAILVRILRNLKNLYLERANLPAALAACERIVLIDPSQPHDIRDRGLLRARLGQTYGALQDFERYAHLHPRADDLSYIQQQAQLLAQHMSQGN